MKDKTKKYNLNHDIKFLIWYKNQIKNYDLEIDIEVIIEMVNKIVNWYKEKYSNKKYVIISKETHYFYELENITDLISNLNKEQLTILKCPYEGPLKNDKAIYGKIVQAYNSQNKPIILSRLIYELPVFYLNDQINIKYDKQGNVDLASVSNTIYTKQELPRYGLKLENLREDIINRSYTTDVFRLSQVIDRHNTMIELRNYVIESIVKKLTIIDKEYNLNRASVMLNDFSKAFKIKEYSIDKKNKKKTYQIY